MRKILITGILIFIFAFVLRLWNLNVPGQWSDEEGYLQKGYKVDSLIGKGDFLNKFFYEDGADHPLFAVYFYGLTSLGDIQKPGGRPIFKYDFTYSRLLSVFLASLSVTLVYFFCIRFVSYYAGICASVILASMPHFMGYSQFVGLETWVMLTFTSTVFSYFLYLDTGKKKYLIVTGILSGISLLVKQSNILIFVFLLIAYLIKKYFTKKKSIKFSHFFVLLGISFGTIAILYPMPFFHIKEYLSLTYNLWFKGGGKIPELLFGKRMGAPFLYYLIAFFVTTPVVVIVLSALGSLKIVFGKRNWITLTILAWLLVPFLMSFFHERQHMVRYIIQFYAPLAIVSAIGLEKTSKQFFKKAYAKYLLVIPVFLYMFVILWKTTPYYLEYYNELVGGTKNVYQNKLFLIGWFGEGLKGPGKYIAQNAKKGDLIGRAVNPGYSSLYQIPTLKYESFDPKKRYNYVVVNYYNIIRSEFDVGQLKNYKLVYAEKTQGIDLAMVYKYQGKH